MPPRIDTEQNSSCRQGTDRLNHGESAVATIWLVLYVLAVGVAITTFLAPGLIEFAAR